MGDIVSREKFSRGWVGGLPETPCGHGSTLGATTAQRKWIPRLIETYGIKSIVDVGAGDLNWISITDLGGATYIPFDLIPRHPSVKQFDLVRDVPPVADMLMCLWVLNHLDFETCRAALKNLKASGSRYLLMTDRPKWHHEQPPEIVMPHIEELKLNEKGDRILLCLI